MIVQYNIMELDTHSKRDSESCEAPASSEKICVQIDELARARERERALERALKGIALVQAAEEALAKIHSLLNRMTELATRAADATAEDNERIQLQSEFNKLYKEIDRISSEAIWKKEPQK